MPLKCCLFTLLVFGVALPPVAAQFSDDFEDGELTSNPAWTGELELWTIEALPGGRRLVTRGLAQSDTLLIETATARPFGTWRFRYGYVGGALSNFNQVRVFLWADPNGDETSYYLLLGSNDRSVKLYETAGSGRSLLAAGRDNALDSDSADVDIRVERDYTGTWRVWVDDAPTMDEVTTTPAPGDHGSFRLWVKHTSARGQDHWFDDVSASPVVESDNLGPSLQGIDVIDLQTLTVRFSEPVDTESACRQDAFELNLNGDTVETETVCPAPPFADSLRLLLVQTMPPGAHRLTAYNVADPSGNLTVSDTVAFTIEDFGDIPRPGDLVINEIDFAPVVAESEFVELLSLSPRPIDLSEVFIADQHTMALAANGDRATIPPGGYVVLTRDLASFESRFPGVEAIEVSGWPSLNNGGDVVTIRRRGSALDSVAYAGPSGGLGSLERTDPRAPSDLPTNWAESISPRGATPAGRNSVYHPDTTSPQLAFVEQTSPKSVRVVFTEPIAADALSIAHFRLGNQRPSLLAAGTPRYSEDYLLRFEEVTPGVLHVDGLIDPSGNETAFSSAPIQMLPRPEWLVVNEIMFEPRVDQMDGVADQAEYIELWNLAQHAISINSCALSGPPDEHDAVDTRPVLSTNAGVPEHGYVILVDSRLSSTDIPLFDHLPPESIRRLQNGSLSLRNTGSRMSLSCAGEEIESVKWDPGWHHPHLVESRGVSLERISPVAPADDPRSWTSSLDPSGGTPGRANTVTVPTMASEQPLLINPSPFSPDSDGDWTHTVISYRLKTDRALVRITVYDSRGRTVRHLSRGHLSARNGSMVWDGRSDRQKLVPTGIYIVFLEATDGLQGSVETRKEVVVVARGF